jgi:hypothetical protein
LPTMHLDGINTFLYDQELFQDRVAQPGAA